MSSETPPTLATHQIERLLRPYGVPVDERLCAMIQAYLCLLFVWNRKVSLTAIARPEEAVCIHFGESMFAAYAAGIEKGRLADIGTGAGFPGIPIRMVRQSIDLTLVEANAKKAAFLGEAVRKLELSSVRIIRSRMEQSNSLQNDRFDFITTRAVGSFMEVLRWSGGHLSPSGSVILFVGQEDADAIAETPDWAWSPEIHIPQSRSRFLLVGKRI